MSTCGLYSVVVNVQASPCNFSIKRPGLGWGSLVIKIILVRNIETGSC